MLETSAMWYAKFVILLAFLSSGTSFSLKTEQNIDAVRILFRERLFLVLGESHNYKIYIHSMLYDNGVWVSDYVLSLRHYPWQAFMLS